jgi:hypothetical protein
VDASPYGVDTEQWKGQTGATQGMSQASTVMAECRLCLDALENESDRRLAREYIRTLGGQVFGFYLQRIMREFAFAFTARCSRPVENN